INMWLSYGEAKRAAVLIQQEKAQSAAERIQQFIGEIEHQIGWTTHAQWSFATLDQRRYDFVRLLGQVPAITELVQIDGAGKEQLKVSRLALDVVGGGTDLSADPRFVKALAEKIWYSPVYFRKQSEPYMTIAIAHAGRQAGVTAAEVNLKLIWDVVTAIKVGRAGYAYVVNSQGRLIAHPDISLVLRDTDLSRLPQVSDALATLTPGETRSGSVTTATGPTGIPVLTAFAAIPHLDWLVFVELPVREAMAPVYASLTQTGTLLGIGLLLAAIAGTMLARRMTIPIHQLQSGAERLGAGELEHRIEIRTGDEIEVLADRFNRMGAQLQESYETLELKVEARSRELARSVDELRALSEVGLALSSTLKLKTVLRTMVERAAKLADADGGMIFRYNRTTRQYELWHSAGLDGGLIARLAATPVHEQETEMGHAARDNRPIEIADLAAIPPAPIRDIALAAGFRSALIVPLVRSGRIYGALIVQRRASGGFAHSTVDILQTFASQSVLAIQNARLFREVEEKGRQLAIASQHKSQFLANMSHELRTPLNAVLGYAELLLDGIYGELPEKARGVLERVHSNGKHLLGLINDVLDLSKIEAGQLTLSIEDYAMQAVVHSVVGATESLAQAKGLSLVSTVPRDLPTGRGDERRVTQVLLNLVGNAIKFTEKGSVGIAVAVSNGCFELAVSDTGPGIAKADQARIFEEFQQVDSSSTRQKGGTGLGLAISKRIIEMHGGAITLDSEPGKGSTFRVVIPVQVEQVKEVA
ncbi:MAG: GAF domain-containing protein, partial [Alphaproteobacteria bacterium]|nr:GAF domain-containing protein [Alphaproteobacteria bacterium]